MPKPPTFTRPLQRSNYQHPGRRVFVRKSSPDQIADINADWYNGDEYLQQGWDPIGFAVEKISAGAKAVADIGRTVINAAAAPIQDLAGTAYAMATGEPPSQPGPIFEAAARAAGQVFALYPEAIKKAIAPEPTSNVAGYVITSDGRRIPVAKYQDPLSEGEKAMSSALKSALRQNDTQLAVARETARIKDAQLRTSAEQWDKLFQLQKRYAAEQTRALELDNRGKELALERLTSSAAERALWGRPSTIAETEGEERRTIRAVGLGLPGSPIRYGTSRAIK